MVAAGHEIGNHSQTHDPILMLRRFSTLYKEIADCQLELNKLGIIPYSFRPPVGITNPKLPRILNRLGLNCVGFSNRPRDFGNRRINRLAEKVLKALKPGSIILLHDKIPDQTFSLADWLMEVERIITGIHQKGLSIVPLSELIARPVMHVPNAGETYDNSRS
jgi:peptidoglycan/xylan/chitin deacetylase (PgdA/CDA1 family)